MLLIFYEFLSTQFTSINLRKLQYVLLISMIVLLYTILFCT